MLKIVYGDDRIRAQAAIKKLLSNDYETIEAENLAPSDMASVFYGTSIFGDSRKILVKSLNENSDCWPLLANYADTPHDVVVWNNSLDKRQVAYKELSKKKVEFKEFKLAEDPNKKLVFDIYDFIRRGNTEAAINACEKIESTNDPYALVGLLASQAYKDLGLNRKVPRYLKILANYDIKMKSVDIDAWKLVKIAIIEMSKI